VHTGTIVLPFRFPLGVTDCEHRGWCDSLVVMVWRNGWRVGL